MSKWINNIFSYLSGSNNSANNSPRERNVSEMEAGQANTSYAAHYSSIVDTKQQSPRHYNNEKGKGKGKSTKRRYSSSSDDDDSSLRGDNGPLLPVSINDGEKRQSPRGVFDPNVMTPTIKKRGKKSKSKRKRERTGVKAKRVPKIEGLECSRPVSTERCFLIKYQQNVYYVCHRDTTIFKALLNLIETRLSELHRLKPLYWPARHHVDGTPIKEAFLQTLLVRVMTAEFETLRNSSTLTTSLFNFAMNAPPEVPYSSGSNSPRSAPAVSQTPSFISTQTRFESMLPAPLPSSSTSRPQGPDGGVHKRHLLQPRQQQEPNNDTVIVVGDASSNMLDEDEDSGDGKIHKNRAARKRQEALERRREIAKKQFPEQLQKFMALPVEKRLDVIKRLEARKKAKTGKGGRIVLRTGIGGDDAKKDDMDILIRGMKAFVDDDDGDDSSDFSSSANGSDGSKSSSQSYSSSDDDDDDESSSSSSAQEMQNLGLDTRLQPVWLESVCDGISAKEGLEQNEVRKWYRHHYQSNITSWVAIDATIAYILLHQSGAAAQDLGLTAK